MLGTLSLRSRALKMLARREHSRQELRRKLAAHGEADDVEKLLDELVKQGWVSEQRVVEQLVHARRGRFGSRRIRQELLEKGVAEEIVEPAIRALEDGELEAARAVWRKKFGKLPGNMSERGRQTRFLLNRGFTSDVIRRVLARAGD